MHPFVALMRRYCIDYTNSHDQSVCEEIMEPDYVVHISGMSLERSTTYADSVAQLFSMAPGLGLVVHELVLGDDRLCMSFSEHAAMPKGDGSALACWRGIGMYKWNGRRLTENYVEQDYLAMQRQIADGVPDSLLPPHLDPWTTTVPMAPDPRAEEAVRSWIAGGDLAAAERIHIDDGRTGAVHEPVLDVEGVTINDLFSAGDTVPFHVTFAGSYRGGLGPALAERVGEPASLDVAGIARLDADHTVAEVDAVTARMQTAAALRARHRDDR